MSSSARSRPVSLLVISHSYPPVLGGSEIEVQRVCAALLRRGHRVTVLCAGGPPMPPVSAWVDPTGVPVRIFAHRWKGRYRDYAFSLAVAWTLFRERRNYQLVYFLMQGLHLATGLPAAHWLRKPVVMKFSGSSLIAALRRSWLGRLELRWLQKWARRVMILNPGMEGEAAAAGFEPRHLLWMPNPVDTAEFAPCSPEQRRGLRLQLSIPPQAPAVIFVGRLAPEKELSCLLAAFASVVQSMPQAVLILVGDGPCRQELEAQACHLGLSASLRFTGRQSVDQVRRWLQASDVFALVSSNEGFPCSLLEAMSVGCASVVSDIPANAQLIDHCAHGLRVPLGGRTKIAEALLRLLGDPELRDAMGRAARQRVIDNYSVDKVLDRYEELFYEALDGARR
jgi:glycosyltransferase involved in cell wall biosynthesis